MTTPVHLVLLPGLGADERLFGPQREAFPQLVVPRWIPAHAKESLPEYAARLSETIPRLSPMVLGGCSLGGMVAHEMARRLRPAAVALIGSCRSHRGIRGLFRSLHALADRLPVGVLDATKPLAPVALAAVMRLSPAHKMLCAAMFREADSAFMQWALGAILAWEPTPPPDGIPVFQIHGEKDLLIPAREVEADEIIPGGGHLINLTHPERVNALIRRAIEAAG